MSSPPPIRPATTSDALRAFRDQAAGVLAEERGFTPQCRIKLARIARQFGLSDAQAEEAIRSLKEGERAKVTDPIVEKFRQRLRKDLSGRSKTVIGPEIEARVVESAKRKYGLDETTVCEVLAEVAAELGLRHITGDQAVRLYLDLVDQAIGDATWLAREAWDRLRSAGEKWGLSFEEADDLIEQKLAANRRATAASRWQRRLIVGGSLAAVLLVAGTLVGLYFKNRPPQKTPAVARNSESPPPTTDTTKKPLAQPAWWDVDLTVAMAASRREIEAVSQRYDDLRSDQGAQRQAAYEALVKVAFRLDAGLTERQSLLDLLAGCHALDPDEQCAERLRQALLSLVPDASRPLQRSNLEYEQAYFGVETALALLARPGMPAARAESLADEISGVVGLRVSAIGSNDPEALRSALVGLTRVLYRHLTVNGPRQPEAAAALQPYLVARASLWLTPSEIERLNTAFLVAMLTGAEKAWKTFEPLMTSLAQSRDPLVVLELLQVYRKVENSGLQRTLGDLLVRRTGARPRGDDPRQIARAVRQALGAAGVPIAQSAEDRWEDLQGSAEAILGRPQASSADRQGVLLEAIELADQATRAIALAQGEPGFAIFDELVQAEDKGAEAGAEAPADAIGLLGSAFRPPAVRKRPLTLQEKQALARSIGQLSEFQSQPPVLRVNALRGVAARVPQASDLTYDQATLVARYLLAAKSDEEQSTIRELIEQLRSWKQVRLAVADRWTESKLTAKQNQQLVDALFGAHVTLTGFSIDAQRQQMLRDVLADLEAGDVIESPTTAASAALPMEGLTAAYQQRARALAVPLADYRASALPAGSLEVVVRALGRRVENRRSAATAGGEPPLDLKLKSAAFLASSDPQHVVLLQRLLLEVMAQRVAQDKPAQAAAARQIVADLAAADVKTSDLLLQIRDGERSTLVMGMLYAVP